MKVNQKKLGMMIVAASLTLGTVSCKKEGCTDDTATNYNSEADKDDGSCTYDLPGSNGIIVEKTGFIYSDQTWVSDSIYHITGKVIVETGATLTIMPGTIVTGAQGSGANASALVIAQGGMINACGTATQPIIFTSELDNIQPGQLTGTNLDENDQGLWGGVIVLGNAPISAADGDNLSQIEGIPATDTYGAFGGSNASDNSGSMCYISIRHGGALIGAGNEINGLTLGGVGSGTSISNIEVVSNLDDGIEFFGGTVDVSNVLIGFQGDDGIDIDMNYSGTVSNFTVISGSNSDEGLEIDGPEGTTYTTGMFTLQNGTVFTYGGTDAHVDFKSKAQGNVNNVSMGEVMIRASYQNACADPKTDALTHLTDASATLSFTGCQFPSVLVYTTSEDGAGNLCTTLLGADQTAAEGAMSTTTATGADASGFASWSWAGVNGKL